MTLDEIDTLIAGERAQYLHCVWEGAVSEAQYHETEVLRLQAEHWATEQQAAGEWAAT